MPRAQSRAPKVGSHEPKGEGPEPTTSWDDMAVVGRIARPHGLRGRVVVNPETDFVEERFRGGAVLWVRTAVSTEKMVVATARIQQGRPVIGFEGIETIEGAERLVSAELRVPEDVLHPLDPGSFYHHQLVGLPVETLEGVRVGDVKSVESGAGGSRLVVDGPKGEVLIPLAVEICVEIDVPGGRIRIAPPEGLLGLNQRGDR